MTFRTAIVLSDTHGYYDLMIRLLSEEGVLDSYGNWIAGDDVQLIHLGDTVDRGPDSAKTFEFLRDLQAARPEGQVIRLMGNHEFAYCGGPTFWGADLPEVVAVRDHMVEDGKSGSLCFAHDLTVAGQDWLLVHGGFHPHWNGLSDEPLTPAQLTKFINGVGVDFFTKFDPRWRWNRTNLTPEDAQEMQTLETEAAILTEISWSRGGRSQFSGVVWTDLRDDLLPNESVLAVNQIVGHCAHEQVLFSPGGKVIGVNVHYGTAQLLRIDLETGDMHVSDLLYDDSIA